MSAVVVCLASRRQERADRLRRQERAQDFAARWRERAKAIEVIRRVISVERLFAFDVACTRDRRMALCGLQDTAAEMMRSVACNDQFDMTPVA